MRLKTELTNEQPFGRHVAWKEPGDLYHDAAMAHALVQAMGELEAANQNDAADVLLTLAMIDERARELMIEWKYAEVDDERMA